MNMIAHPESRERTSGLDSYIRMAAIGMYITGSSPITIAKWIRTQTGCGLKESMDTAMAIRHEAVEHAKICLHNILEMQKFIDHPDAFAHADSLVKL